MTDNSFGPVVVLLVHTTWSSLPQHQLRPSYVQRGAAFSSLTTQQQESAVWLRDELLNVQNSVEGGREMWWNEVKALFENVGREATGQEAFSGKEVPAERPTRAFLGQPRRSDEADAVAQHRPRRQGKHRGQGGRPRHSTNETNPTSPHF